MSADTLAEVGSTARLIAERASTMGPAGESIRVLAVTLAGAREIDRARSAFGALGDAIMMAAKASGGDLGEGIRVAYCPMVKKYWFQRGEEIKNPFYGKEMLDCGRLVAQIPDLRPQMPPPPAR